MCKPLKVHGFMAFNPICQRIRVGNMQDRYEDTFSISTRFRGFIRSLPKDLSHEPWLSDLSNVVAQFQIRRQAL